MFQSTAITTPIESTSRNRFEWIDQVKGFTIFLVVYGHNFPFCEKYIYSFHMPLFITIAGFFHPKNSSIGSIRKRFISLVVPYFLWSLFLYAAWFFVTRHYGESASLHLSPIKNLIGVFYGQGDRAYMDWGIPLWYLLALFVTFLLLSTVLKFENQKFRFGILAFIVALGFIYSHLTSFNLPWSVNIATVALFFYSLGFYTFGWISKLPTNQSIFFMIVSGALNLLLFNYNIKIDMYRAIYGNEALFIINGVTGSLFILCFFKVVPFFNIIGFIGKFSLVILALQLLAMTFIKLILLVVWHRSEFNFSETERFGYAFLQIALMVPGFFLINKYVPILNGGYKKI